MGDYDRIPDPFHEALREFERRVYAREPMPTACTSCGGSFAQAGGVTHVHIRQWLCLNCTAAGVK